MTGQEYLEHIVQLLLQYGITQQITEEMIRTASELLQRHATDSYLQRWGISPRCLLEALIPFLPETPLRFVWFDAEMDGPTYAEIVRGFANATSGEWVPQQVAYDVVANEGADSYRLTVDFDVCGEPIHGEWTRWSLKWIEDGFLDLMKNIAGTHLSGEFVEIPTHDQTMLFAYLPRQLARKLQILLDQLEQEYADFVMLAQTFRSMWRVQPCQWHG